MTKRKTRAWYDLEFHDRGALDHPIDVISIGMVTEDDGELYLQNYEADWPAIAQNPWLVEHVLPHLVGFDMRTLAPTGYADGPWRRRAELGPEILKFLGSHVADGDGVQLRGYYGAYDHVAMMGLWGPMIEKPEGLPMWTYDLKQRCTDLEERMRRVGMLMPEHYLLLPKQMSDEHHPLADAKWNRDADGYLDLWEQRLVEMERRDAAR